MIILPRKHTLAKRITLAVVLAGVVAGSTLTYQAITHKPQPNAAPPIAQAAKTPEKPRAELPVRLKIPKLSVDAVITPVGLTPDGDMDIKKDPDITAWYSLGPRPGETGSAVIAGHYGWDNGKASVFTQLHTLQKGDVVTVEDSKGQAAAFVVRESRQYAPDAVVPEVFKSSDGKAHLNLITCQGDWNDTQQTYSSRLVVFADQQ